LKLITKVLTLRSKPEKLRERVCSIHFHHVHSLLLSGCLSLSEPHSCMFISWLFLGAP